MNRIASALVALTVAATPAVAEDAKPSAEEGFSLLEEGAKIILRSLMDEVEPALKDMHKQFGEAVGEMGPALQKLAEMIGDIRNYDPPEMLPNGDIILRRKTPLVPALPEPGPNGEIEL
ncbi:MAG: hypothetical protein V9G18_05540 [Albidovulum sp.]|jgi:hypothetical protein|uniref:hypothetical protein n=1 Tax=Albidovulum sp. TaxID=1872424 RepID=UPI003054F814